MLLMHVSLKKEDLLMSNIVGLSIVGAFLLLEMGLAFAIRKMKLTGNLLLAVFVIMVLLPAGLLIAINTWEWPSTIHALVDLPYSWFHFMFVALTLLFAYGAIKLGMIHNHLSDKVAGMKAADRTVFLFGLFLLGIEAYKQIFYGNLFTSYAWYLFPFQFCSVPMYVCLIAPWFGNGKAKEASYSFIAIFGLIAGLAVMALPNTVFVQRMSICIHTMIWHGGMTVIGTYLVANRAIGSSFKQWRQASGVLSIFIAIAIVLDLLLHKFLPDVSVNIFFLSPWSPSPFPVLSTVLANGQTHLGLFWGWIIYLICYLAVFFLGGMMVYFVAGIFTVKHRKVYLHQPA
jgi:hypothetical protein